MDTPPVRRAAARRARYEVEVIAGVSFQPSLFDRPPVSFDGDFSGLRRVWLDERAFVDVVPGWVRGSDALFTEILATRPWAERTRWMYARRVVEPRLTAPWSLASGTPLEPAILDEMRLVLIERYGAPFDSAGFNLYRNGRDSVAWHADRIEREIVDPIIALVSLGEPRPFLLRPRPPRARGRSVRFVLGRGDLLVTSGPATRSWEHCVPKVAHAGPRISVAFRHGLDPRAYAGKRSRPFAGVRGETAGHPDPEHPG